jgi:hypothetical protein
MTTDKYVETLRQIQALVAEALNDVHREKTKPAKPQPHKSPHGAHTVSFDMNILAFMSKYARGRSGPQKFTLLVAYLAKGNASGHVPYQDITSHWNKMKTVLGDFNAVHGNRAKAKGWVEPEQKGTWKLTSSWKDVLS